MCPFLCKKNVTCQISQFWHKNGVASKICEFRAGVTKRDSVHFGGKNFYGANSVKFDVEAALAQKKFRLGLGGLGFSSKA